MGCNMNNYWISWYSPETNSEFEIHSPWWISGYSFDPDAVILVAAIRAESEEAAWKFIRDSYDEEPEITERFIEDLGDKTPFSGRFPQSSWMAWDEDRTCACGEDEKH